MKAFYIGFSICALLAGIFDFLFYRIPNLFVGAMIGLFLIMLIITDQPQSSLFPLAVASVSLMVCFTFYTWGWLGAGDVKLIAAASLWATNISLLGFFLFVSLIGGLLALTYSLLSVYIDQIRAYCIPFLKEKFQRSKFFASYSHSPFLYATSSEKKEMKIPYGVAVTAGCLLITYLALFREGAS